jgi:DNA polymerase-3 subunit epsilon
VTECREFLESLCSDFGLCPKYCHLQEQVSHCTHFRVTSCNGICRGEETVVAYNKKVLKAIRFVENNKENFIIREQGRNSDEDAMVLVQDGQYRGYGFVPKEINIRSMEDIMAYVHLQKETIETKRLVASYALKNLDKLIPLNE